VVVYAAVGNLNGGHDMTHNAAREVALEPDGFSLFTLGPEFRGHPFEISARRKTRAINGKFVLKFFQRRATNA